MADSGNNLASRIAFTLPLSCQICLGKVKLPVVCPNQHVFCSPCMDVWLQRNQQCPSCRVSITPDNPCKKILGGLTQNDEELNSFAKSKELRRSRLELLFKDYENEVERLQMENDAIRQEKCLLEEQVRSYATQKMREAEEDVAKGTPTSSSSVLPQPDVNMLLMLTKKLQDATGLYERVKKDMDRLKRENADVKDENAAITRENQRVRAELIGRSPHKFGRITVTTLEAKLEKYEKEMNQLQKALERSDAYIEEVEKELEANHKKSQQQGMCIRCKCTLAVENEQKEQEKEKDNSGNLGYKCMPVSTTNASSTWDGRIRPDINSECSDIARRTVGDCHQKPFTLTAEGQKPMADLRDAAGGDRNHLTTKDAFEVDDKKRSMTVASFYGKRSIGRKDHPGVMNSQLSKKLLNELTESSFDLEMPSPASSSVVSSTEAVGRLTIGQYNDDGISTSNAPKLTCYSSTSDRKQNDSMASTSSSESCKKRLKFESDMSDVSGLSLLNSPKKVKNEKKLRVGAKQVTFNQNVAIKNMIKSKNALSDSLLDITLPSDMSEVDILNDVKLGQEDSTLVDDSYDENMSMNSDIIDCMELFSCAEKRLGQRRHSNGLELHQAQHSTTRNGSGRDPPKDSQPQLAQTFPPVTSNHHQYQPDLRSSHGLPGGLLGGSSSANFQQGDMLSHLSSSKDTKACPYPDSVSSSGIDTYNPYWQSASKSTSEHGSVTTGHNEESSLASGRSTTGRLGLQPQPFCTAISDTISSTATGSSSVTEGISSTAVAHVVPLLNGQNYPPQRPASTSTLRGMIQTLNSLGEEVVRPLSAPGLQHSFSTHSAASNRGDCATVCNPSSTSAYNVNPSSTSTYNNPNCTSTYNDSPSSASTYNNPNCMSTYVNPSSTSAYNVNPSSASTYGNPSSTSTYVNPSSTFMYNVNPSSSSTYNVNNPGGGISSVTSDFRPGSSVPVASSGGSQASFFMRSQSCLTGLHGAGLSQQPGSKNSLIASKILPSMPDIRMGCDSGPSQPTGRFPGDIGSVGMFGSGSSSVKFIPGFGGSLTQ